MNLSWFSILKSTDGGLHGIFGKTLGSLTRKDVLNYSISKIPLYSPWSKADTFSGEGTYYQACLRLTRYTVLPYTINNIFRIAHCTVKSEGVYQV